MAVTTTKTNKPINPRGNDQSPLAYNRAKLYSGKALDFDGVNDYLTFDGFAGTLSNNDAWTVCGYFKTSNVNRGTWFSAHNSSGGNIFRIGTESGNALGLFYADNYQFDTQIGDFDFIDDKMHFVVLSRAQGANGSLATLYVDGIESATQTTGPNWDSATQFSLGQEYDGGSTSDFWDGLLANFKIFNTALTAAQVADLYNNPEKVVPTGVDNTALKLWLPMMEGAGTTAYDGSGNGNHGTISGATYVHGVGAPVSQSAVIDWNKGVNYQTYSEEFTIAWALYGVSISTDQTTAPDGLNTADLYDDGTGTGTHLVEKTCANLSSAVGVSGFIYAKYIDTQYLVLGTYDTGYHFAVYDIQNGTLGTKMGGVTSSIEAAGNGFYKCSFTYSANTRINPYLSFSFRDDDVANYYDGTGTNRQAYIWGASLRPTTDGDAYVRTGANAQTSEVLLPQGLTSGRDITGVNLFENVRKQGALNLLLTDYASVHDNSSIDLSTDLTLEAWVYFDGSSVSGGIIAKYHYSTSERSYDIRRNTSGNVQFTISDNGINTISLNYSGSKISTGWHHVLATYDQSQQKLYIDGVLNVYQNATISLYQTNKPVVIGKLDPTQSANSFEGQIAQPRIYNRALTAEEVERNYNAGKNIYK